VLFALVVFVFRALVSLVFSFICMYVGRDVYRKNGQCCFVSTQRWDFFFFFLGSFMCPLSFCQNSSNPFRIFYDTM
jgi:hypothetical protein